MRSKHLIAALLMLGMLLGGAAAVAARKSRRFTLHFLLMLYVPFGQDASFYH